jgi:hypothetical protein
MNINLEVIDKLLDQVDSISNITFTGGEPSLYPKAIQYFADGLRKRKMNIYGFYVVTNGKLASKAMVHALIDLYDLCNGGDEKYSCSLVISQDQYHDVPNKIPALYRALKFFQPDARKGTIPWEGVIDEGRANYNGIGHREEKVEDFNIELSEDGGQLTINDILYVSSNGNVISSCDLSYNRIDKEARGNILTEPLIDIVGARILIDSLADKELINA